MAAASGLPPDRSPDQLSWPMAVIVPSLVAEALWRESVVVALPGNYPLTRRTIVDVSELATEVFVLARPEETVAFHDEVFRLCRRAGFTPRVAHGVPDVQAAIAFVAAGLGISPVPAAIQGFKRKGVVYRPLRPHTFRIEMGLAWRRDEDNVSSVIGEMGNIGQANYAASKSGLFGLTKTLAKEAAFLLVRSGKLTDGDGIGLTVNTVTPGFVATEMVDHIPGKVMERIVGQIPIGRLGRPDEVARVVHSLAADASSYITGQVWGVNGGLDM